MTIEKTSLDETVKRLWEDVYDQKQDYEALATKFRLIESEFTRIKQILKDSTVKGWQEMHRL